MKHRRWLWALLAVLLVAGGIWWTTGADFVRLPTGPVVIDMKFVDTTEGFGGRFNGPLPLDEHGRAEMPFANASGKLLFELRQGKLRVDTNGDGVIDQRDAPAVLLNPGARSAMVKVAAIIGGQTVQYPLSVRLDVYNSDSVHVSLFVLSQAQLQGVFAGRLIRIFDDNSNGRFDDPADSVVVGPAKASQHDRLTSALEWNHTLALGKHLFSMELLGNGRQLKLTPYTGPLAKVAVQMGGAAPQFQLRLCHVDHVQAGWVFSDQTAWFVPGKYRVTLVRGVDTPEWQAAMAADAGPLELKAGDNVVKVGAPFSLDFAAVRDGDKIEFTNARILGCASESYQFWPRSAHDECFAAFIRASGKEQRLTDLGFS